jgi:hypothetical protein
MNWWPEQCRLALMVALAGVLCAMGALGDAPPALSVDYQVLRNDKPLGEAHLSHESDGVGWKLASRSKGTRGGARLLGFSEETTSQGRYGEDGLPQPLQFRQQVKAALKERGWEADFDWAGNTVATRHENGASSLELLPGTQDPLSAGLRVRQGLSRDEDHWSLGLVDKDEIDLDEFRVTGEEAIDTALGCFETVRVEKIRAPDSTRYTRTWYAKDHGWAPVRMEHGKTGGSRLETRLVSLSIDGQGVAAGPACNPATALP